MDIDAILRRHIYDVTCATGAPPTIEALAAATGQTAAEIDDGLTRLAAARVIVRQPASGELLMVPPFSAVPTPFLVSTERHTSYANCAWDALGVAVMMGLPARVHTACGCCGDAISLAVDPGQPPAGGEIVHFAVPAARWWQDIVFT
jgi:hypothetical protein